MEKELLISYKDIQSRIKKLAKQISSDYADNEPVFIGVLNGVIFFFADLIKELTIPSKIDFIRASSYGPDTSSSGSINITKDVEISIQGKPVIVVEDIVDTGLTLTKITDMLWERDPESIRICTLIDKMERREKVISIDYYGFRIDKGFLVGYGLDHDERYRYLKDIYTLSASH
ncbi:hypoxanthine phosphoribosyltransferase [Thermodesulfobacteriota bacterium]